MTRLDHIRRWFAEDLSLRVAPLRNPSLIDAFAAVPRERFLGDGPWQLIVPPRFYRPFASADADPRWLYHDLLVAIDASRGLNNGQPSFWMHNFDELDLRPGQRVMQIGAGTGYYSAILAELVGPRGRVVAVEFDSDLAARARANAKLWPQIAVVAVDGRTHDPGELDAIVACAGCTHPAPLWLDRLAEGGRLVMPLTGEHGWGFMLRAQRHGDRFEAHSVGGVGIYHCEGGRDADAARRLREALELVGSADMPVAALHRGAPPEGAQARCWFAGPGYWLERAPGGV